MAEQRNEPSLTRSEYPGLHALFDEMLAGGQNARLAAKMFVRSLVSVNDQRRQQQEQADLAVAKIARLTDTDLMLFLSSFGQYLLREDLQRRRARRRRA